MNPKVKVVFTVLIILISLSLAGGGFYLYKTETAKNVELEDKIEELSTKQKIAEAKFVEAQRIQVTLDEKLKDALAQIEILNTKLTMEQSAKDEALAKMEAMRSDLEAQKDLRLDLEKKLAQAQGDVRSIQDKLTVIDKEKGDLESKVSDLEAKSNVELGKIVVSPETKQTKKSNKATVEKASPAKGEEGKIMVINKEYNFAVINLGSKDGLNVGDQFSIYRSNKFIGDLKIEKLQESMSAAGFVTDGIKDKAKEGDKVIKKS